MNRNEFENAYLGDFDPPNMKAVDIWCVYYSLLETFRENNPNDMKYTHQFEKHLDEAANFLANDLEISQEDRLEAKKEVRRNYSHEAMMRRAASSDATVQMISILVRKITESSSPTYHVV